MPREMRSPTGRVERFLLGRGERQTLDGLFRRHGDAVYRLAAVTLGDREEAGDVTQEVFLHAARKLGELRDLETLWPWLKTVTLNLCRDRARKARRHPSASLDPEAGTREAGGCPPAVDDGGWPTEMDLVTMVVRDCVVRLAPKERQVIVPYYQHGMTYRELAGHLGWSVASVQWWMDRGLKHLAELVTAELGSEEWEEQGEASRNGGMPSK